MVVDSNITFLMDLLVNAPATLHALTDHKYISEIPISDAILNGAHKTLVGMTILGANQQSYFMSQIRGYVKTDITAQITVLTSMGSNDAHCREVVSAICEILHDASYIGVYRIFVNSAKWEIKPDGSPRKYVGNITIDISRFDPV